MAAGGGEGGFGVRVVDGASVSPTSSMLLVPNVRSIKRWRLPKNHRPSGLCASIGATGRTRRRAF